MEYEEIVYECAESYHQAAQLSVTVLDKDDSPIHSFGKQCAYCVQFKNLAGEERCVRRHSLGCRMAAELKKGHVFSCQGGLIMFAVALTQNEKHVGSIITGPVLPEMPTIRMVDEILKNLSLPLTGRGTLYSALTGVDLVEPRRIEYLCRLLHNATHRLLDAAPRIRQESLEKAEEKRRVQDYLSAIQTEPKLNTDDSYLIDLENKFTQAVRVGNVQDAANAIEQIFTTRCISLGMQTKLTTIHAIELLTLLAHTAIGAGANVNTMYKLTDQAFCRLMEARSINQISSLLEQSVKDALDMLDVVRADDTNKFIRKTMYYIQQHYAENFTLEDVSKSVHLSASYLSSLFKEKTGVHFTSYVNQLKVERAKKLLKKTDMTLANIAVSLGFCSQSYFSQTFKRYAGMSPKQYRYMSSRDIAPIST